MYTLFSAHRTFIKNIHYILCHKTKLNQFKRIQIIQSKFCDHEGINLIVYIWKLNSILLNKTWVKVELKRELRNILNLVEMRTLHTNLLDVAKLKKRNHTSKHLK